MGDNGTDHQITSIFNGLPYEGGKAYTEEAGVHLPLIVKWPGYIKEGVVNNSLVNLTDFLPTLANLAKMDTPQNYGQLDGVSFYPQLFGANDTVHPWSFCHFEPALSNLGVVKRWAQNNNYKLYDYRSNFYDIINDRFETTPLTDGQLTPVQLALKNSFKQVLDSLK